MRLILAVLVLVAAQQPPARPFVPVGVAYERGPEMTSDFEAMRALGLNTVVVRGDDVELQVTAAARAGLRALVERDASPRYVSPAPATSADVRLRAWEAIARGDGAVYFPRWTSSANAIGLLERDGTIGPRARTAGEFAGIVSRNAALFAPLRPRTGDATRVLVDDTPSGVTAAILESEQAILIVAINESDAPKKVTLRFPPDLPEAIWLNLETGTSLGFIMEKGGPWLEHAFLARDVLVLVRAKRLR